MASGNVFKFGPVSIIVCGGIVRRLYIQERKILWKNMFGIFKQNISDILKLLDPMKSPEGKRSTLLT